MATISILGSGWLGLALVKHFATLGITVHASTRSSERLQTLRKAGAIPFLLDIATPSFDAADFLNADTLIVNIPYKDIHRFEALTTEIAASPVQHVLFISSTSVYQDVATRLTEEDITYLSDSPLVTIEHLFQSIAGKKTSVVRFGGLVGPNRHPGRFFKSGRPIPNPEAPVNMIHLDDCVGIIDAIYQQQAWGQVFNGCAPLHPIKRTFYGRAIALLGRSKPEMGEQKAGTGKSVCPQKIIDELGYQFIHPDPMAMPFD